MGATGRAGLTDAQEHGLSALLGELLAAYLESTNPANDARYMRHGFEPYASVELDGGQLVTTMWRPGRPAR